MNIYEQMQGTQVEREVVGRMGELANNTIRKVHITEHNIENIFAWFEENVWKDKKTSAHDLVGYFVGMLCDSDNHFIHPNKNNILVTPGGQISINGSNYARLISHFDSNLTPEEKKRITAIADRLIEDSSRRRTGDFWTPQVWVDESHRRISSLLGDDWKEKYVVWDAGWYQIKYILKEYMPDDLKAFRKTFKTFESRLRPLVYELGFLRK